MAHSNQTPWDFLSVESNDSVFDYVNGVTLGPHLRMVASGANCVRELELSVPPPDLWGGEGGWKSCLIANGQ